MVGFVERTLGKTAWGRRHARVGGLPEYHGELPVAGLADEILTPGEGQVRGMLVLSAYRPAPELEICLLRTHVAAFPPIGLSCLDARRRAARESKVR